MQRERKTRPRRARIGLQVKSGAILAMVIVGVTAAGAYYYYQAASSLLQGKDEAHARQLAQALSVAAETHLPDRRYKSLDVLLGDLVRDEGVVYVAVVDREGQVVSSAWQGPRAGEWPSRTAFAPDASMLEHFDERHVLVAHPVIARNEVWFDQRLAGGVRIVLDTTATAESLAQARHRVLRTAILITVCGLGVAVVLVWQFMVRPIRELVEVTRELTAGNFSARSNYRRRDETGELSAAFDEMADEVSVMRQKLIEQNEQLEQQVARRTAELERANARLTQEMKDQEDFLRAVSHDLNAPLRNIAGMATMIMMKWKGQLPEDAFARLQRIQSNVETECELLTELLELSRIRTRPEKRDLVDMGDLALQVGHQLEYELDRRHIDYDVVGPMPVLYVERNRMRQVLQNLVDNSIKYMHRETGGRIAVTYEVIEDGHIFCVADNGPGISPEQQQRVFQVFRRGQNAEASHAGGKGVGLAVVRTVASIYHGRAWVESQEGKGTRFYFMLAREATEAPQQQPEAIHV
jgi:signal transduction histidine kinase